MLPIILSEQEVDGLFAEVYAMPGYSLTIDLNKLEIETPSKRVINFKVEEFRRYCLLNGFDDIGLTLRQSEKIKAFETERLKQQPWLARQI